MTASPDPKPYVSPVLKWRKRTTYTKKGAISGYARIGYAEIAEVARITRGDERIILMLLMTEIFGQPSADDQRQSETKELLTTSDLAALACCSERNVTRALEEMQKWGILEWNQPKKGKNWVKLLYRNWCNLKDRPVPGPVLVTPIAEETEEETAEDAAREKTVTQVTRKPVKIAAGRTSKAIPVECGVKALQFSADIDAECSAVVESGTLLVSLKQNADPKKQSDDLQIQKGLDANIRRYGRIFTSNGNANGGRNKGEQREKKGESSRYVCDHPRAQELSDLLDPILYHFSQKTLSGDIGKLQAACEAIGDTPRPELERALQERSKRKFLLTHVEAFCRETQHNWERAKSLPAKKALPTYEEIQAMIAAEKAARKRKAS